MMFGLLISAVSGLAGDDLRIDKDGLKAMLGSPELVVLDVRTGRDWSSSEFKIKGAVRAAARDFATWSQTHTPDQTLVLYCA